ncbi:MAG TPA: hypothetical protein VK646_03260 [Actinomycetota bacterium]|nr:hypothetical protein [Actinomycetota bacterium]
MARERDSRVGLVLAAAGAAVIGSSVVFGLTTESGAVDRIGIVAAAAGVIVVLIGLIMYWRPGAPHPG